MQRMRLRQWIERQDMTVTELARRLGYSRKQVSLIINGSRPVTDQFVGRFARTFGWATADFIFGSTVPFGERDDTNKYQGVPRRTVG